MTITNQTNPIGTTHTSKKSQIIVPKEGITGLESRTKEKIYTAVTLTRSSNNPPKYRQQIIQYNDAKSNSYSVIATKNEDTGEFDFIDNNVDFKNTDQDAFKKLVVDQTKTQKKDAEKQIKNKVNQDKKDINKNEADSNKDDSKNSSLFDDQSRRGIARKNYGVLHYPAFIQRSEQDKLKITIMEFSSRFQGAKINKSKLNSSSNRRPPPPQKKSGAAGRFYQRDLKAYHAKYGKNADKNRVNIGSGGESRLSLDNRGRIEAEKRTVGHITLPIPDGVSDQNQVDFGQGTLNPIQVAGAETALKLLLQGAKPAGENAAAVFNQAVTDPNVKRAISALVTGASFGIDFNELLARTEGNISNNNLELLFKGPNLRPFNFDFNLSARSFDESRMIKKIIRAFKQSSAAQKTTGGLFLHAPNTYKLQFINGKTNKPHEFLPRIKECALLGINMNYMPENTYMTYDDTSMVSYNMRLSFKELEPIFNDDYDKEDQQDTGVRRGSIAAADINQQSTEINSIGF